MNSCGRDLNSRCLDLNGVPSDLNFRRGDLNSCGEDLSCRCLNMNGFMSEVNGFPPDLKWFISEGNGFNADLNLWGSVLREFELEPRVIHPGMKPVRMFP